VLGGRYPVHGDNNSGREGEIRLRYYRFRIWITSDDPYIFRDISIEIWWSVGTMRSDDGLPHDSVRNHTPNVKFIIQTCIILNNSTGKSSQITDIIWSSKNNLPINLHIIIFMISTLPYIIAKLNPAF
jgi:hypothetical protein